MSHIKTLWLLSWLTIAGLTFAYSLRSESQPTAELPVTSASFEQVSHSSRNIEDIRVGDRVMGEWSAGELNGETSVDPQTWRKYCLYAELQWPDGTIDDTHIETIQPPQWAELTGAKVGSQVPLPLDLVEMGLPEGLSGEVMTIEPCPALQGGPGRVVLTTVNHLNRFLFDLSFVSPAGETESVRTTGWHKFYRHEDNTWVSAVDLKIGDTLKGVDGLLTVESLNRVPGTHRVYNMTVEGEHVYRVAQLGVLVHNNACAQQGPRRGTLNPNDKNINFREPNIDPDHVQELRPFNQALSDAKEPINVVVDAKGTKHIMQGNHRVIAAAEDGLDSIGVQEFTPDEWDNFLNSFGD